MSGLWAMANGVLPRDPGAPHRRERQTRPHLAAEGNGDAAQWVSTIAFAEQAERLLSLEACFCLRPRRDENLAGPGRHRAHRT